MEVIDLMDRERFRQHQALKSNETLLQKVDFIVLERLVSFILFETLYLNRSRFYDDSLIGYTTFHWIPAKSGPANS